VTETGRRLQAYLADCGVASRRASERLILEGRVAVNGQPALELGSRVFPGDVVFLDGKPVTPEARLRYIILNKPAGHICAMSDPEGRPLAVDLLKPAVPERIYNVGRLDQWSSGLVIFTNDGAFAAKIGHPSGGIDKEYAVTADGPLDAAFLADFRRGIVLDGIVYRALEAYGSGPDSARIVLVEGKNREIRRVLESRDLRALSIQRVRIGPVSLGALPAGAFRELTETERFALLSYVPRRGGTR
jgi:23S rRNA pseudouridine2605 synthase